MTTADRPTRDPTAADIDALLAFLPALDRAAFEPGRWHEPQEVERGVFTLPAYSFDEGVIRFVDACYAHDWVTPFDWPAWQDEAERLTDDPEAIARADAATIRKLITVHVRKDRFCEGHLAAMFQAGHITRLLRRLAEIRERMRAAES